jgi:hypothetical protein
MAGVWGVCGETAFPGELPVENEPGTMAGTLANPRLDELEDTFS